MTSPAMPVGGRKGASTLFAITVFAVILINYTDRYALSILLNDISREFHLNDTQLGLLGGLPFALLYALAGVPFARIADVVHRGRLIAAAVAVWSFATAGCAMAGSFWSLFFLRTVVGVGEGAGTPTIHSLFADRYGGTRGAGPASLFGLGSALGAFIGMAVGGLIAAKYGWRVAFLIIGLPGGVIASAAWFFLDDRRASGRLPQLSDIAGKQAVDVVRRLLKVPAYSLCVAAMTIVYFVSHGISQWLPVFLVRYHGLSTAEIGPAIGVLTGLGSGGGAILGGYLGVRFARRDVRWLLILPGICSLLMVPFATSIFLMPSVGLVYAAVGGQAVLTGMLAGPSFAAVYGLVDREETATAIATMALGTTILGMGLGPLAVGALSDRLHATAAGGEGLRYALIALSAVIVGVGVLFLAGADHLKRGWKDAEIRT